MSWKNTTGRYGTISIGLHWLMFLLLVAVYACIELREIYPKGTDPREALKSWHFMLGLSVLLLVCFRLIVRLLQPQPGIQPQPAPWQRYLATFFHLALYLFMFAMPVLGWLTLSGEGKPIPFFGLQLPALISENKDFAHDVEEIHELIGTIGYFLIGFHALAALVHHYWFKDNTLSRILPKR